MGQILMAICSCGFAREFLFGGGMDNFKTYLGAPAYCMKCNKMTITNYLNPKSRCSLCRGKIVYYNDESLQIKKDKDDSYFEWGDFILPDSSYKCPECGEFMLRFSFIGNWD